MISPEMTTRMEQAGLGRGSGRLLVCIVLVLAGTAAFLIGVLGSHPERAWQAYHVNFMFWIGVAFGGVLFSAILSMADARWGRPMKRLSEGFVVFLPVACILFGILYLGREHVFPWIYHAPPKIAGWLEVHFLFVRDGAAMLLLTLLGLAIVRSSIRIDRSAVEEREGGPQTIRKAMGAQKTLSVIYGIAYSFLLTLLAFDLLMSLEPHFYSTLFGAWYFMGSFYTAIAAVILLMAYAVRSMAMAPFVKPTQFLSIGQLLLGFCLVTGDFFFTQVLIIWYANLPEETRYVLTRMREQPWPVFAWVVLFSCYVVPFGVLLSRRIKMRPLPMVFLSCLILAGVWVERWMLVAPTLWNQKDLPLGIPEILITAGFLGIVLLCLFWFFSRFPVLPMRDPLFLEMIGEAEKR